MFSFIIIVFFTFHFSKPITSFCGIPSHILSFNKFFFGAEITHSIIYHLCFFLKKVIKRLQCQGRTEQPKRFTLD